MKMSIDYGPSGQMGKTLSHHNVKVISAGITEAFKELPNLVLAEIEVVKASPPGGLNAPEDVVAELQVVIRDELLRDRYGRCEYGSIREGFCKDTVKSEVLQMVGILFEKKQVRYDEAQRKLNGQLLALACKNVA